MSATKKSTFYYPITGCEGLGVHPRYSIEELQANHPQQFTLFILSFIVLQGRDLDLEFGAGGPPTWLSSLSRASILGDVAGDDSIPPALQFPEIAGIHGLPYSQWVGNQYEKELYDGDYDRKDPKDTKPVPSRFGGYCNHGSVLFPTWHRPYVLAIEQAISHVAIRIARSLDISSKQNATSEDSRPNEEGEWTAAARALRFPFWDFADKRVAEEGLPPVLYQEKLTLNFGSTIQITANAPNPLAYYKFKAIPEGFDTRDLLIGDETTTAYFADWKRTYRHAESVVNPTGSNIEKLNEKLKEQAACLRIRVALLFGWDNDEENGAEIWDNFSNHTGRKKLYGGQSGSDKPGKEGWESIESVHDSLHLILGGNGHMADPDTAGFDPIFYLHHSNVDRLFALWEYIYPDYYIGPLKEKNNVQVEGTYTLVYNEEVKGDTRLAPFRVPDGTYWTSDQARFLTDKSKYSDTETYQKYYTYPEVAGIDVSKPVLPLAERTKLRAALQKYYGYAPKPVWTGEKSRAPIFRTLLPGPESHVDVVPGYRDILIAIQTSEFAFNQSYSIELHYDDGTFVGAIGVFARHDTSACASCLTRRGSISTIRGVIPIPDAIVDKVLGLGDVDELDVPAELKRRLRATIVNPRGAAIGRVVRGRTRGADDTKVLEGPRVPEIRLVSAPAALSAGWIPKSVHWTDHGDIFEEAEENWWQTF